MRSPEEIRDVGRFLVALAYFALFFLFGTNLISLLFYGQVVSDYDAYQKRTFVVQETERAHDSDDHDLVKGRINGRYLEETHDGENLFRVSDFSQIKPGDICDVYLNSKGTRSGYGTKNTLLISVEDYLHARARLIKHLVGVVTAVVLTFLIWKKNPWFHPWRTEKPSLAGAKP